MIPVLLFAETVQQTTTTLVVLGFVSAVALILAASVPVYITGRSTAKQRRQDAEIRKAEKAEDSQLKLEVARRVEEAVAAAELVAAHAAEAVADAKLAAAALDLKLTRIAHQTDGLYTTALESELRARIVSAATLREVIALRSAHDPSADHSSTLNVIQSIETKISELEEGLRRRADYQATIAPPQGGEAPPAVEVKIVNPEPVDVVVVDPPAETT